MKICYLANSNSIHSQRWAKHFATRGHDVSVISFDAAKIKGICVYNLVSIRWSLRLNILWNIYKVRRLLKVISPDILHAHYITSYGLSAAFSGRHPIVMTAWGSDVLVMPQNSFIYQMIVRYALKSADLVTTVAEHMTKYLIDQQYVKADKIITFPFGVDPELFNPSYRLNAHGVNNPVVISTRRLDHGLDVDVFIKAIPKVLNNFPDTRFILTGAGLLREQMEQLAGNLNISKKVEFLGNVSHHDMPRLLGAADVFVSTSPSDGNNISLNEAMACGAFPIATDIPANRVWINTGQNGLLFSSGNAEQLAEQIIQALSRPEWRRAVISENWEIIKTKANWPAEMTKVERLYASLLK